jgi:phenylpyruvate tautomerase PptA (4-oxalocrotonate tautomerase family)
MPLVRISLLKGKPAPYRRAISEGIHQALIAAFGIPPDDFFQLIHQHERDEFLFDPSYLDIQRSDDLVIIQIIAGNWRDASKKQILYKEIVDRLADHPGLRREDVMIALTPNARDEWSFGHGVAQYVKTE